VIVNRNLYKALCINNTMGNVIKIGRYFYERIAKDCNGEPKLRDGEEMWNTYWLVCDGEEIEAFRRIKKPNSPKP